MAENEIRWSRVFAALVLGLLIMEVFLRVLLWQWAGEPYQSLRYYRWSPYGLVRNNPNLTSPDFKINANGFRDLKEYKKKKTPGTYRILMLGGSTLYSGLGGVVAPGRGRVDSGHTMSQYLEKELKADPVFSDLKVEVINASVNFNRIVEVSCGYIAEYVHWDPDLVIVCGSSNNFGVAPVRGTVAEKQFNILGPHTWHYEFQRLVNDRSFFAIIERTIRGMGEHSAVLAIADKGVTKAVFFCGSGVNRVRQSFGLEDSPKHLQQFAPLEEFDQYISAYLGYAAAIEAVAQEHDQKVVFFWEHFLSHLDGIKPFSEEEKYLYRHNRRMTADTDRKYTDYARGKVRDFCTENEMVFLDPLEALRKEHGTVFVDYLHYTREGNEFMAKFIYNEMQEKMREDAVKLKEAR